MRGENSDMFVCDAEAMRPIRDLVDVFLGGDVDGGTDVFTSSPNPFSFGGEGGQIYSLSCKRRGLG